ncbi:MAG: hypothetical protein WCI79_02175 [Candidatus Saccharibacteria bacterium]
MSEEIKVKEKKEKLTRSFLGMILACVIWIGLAICDRIWWHLDFNVSLKGIFFTAFVIVTFGLSIVLLFKRNTWLSQIKPSVFCIIGYLIIAFSIADIATLIQHLQVNITIIK